MSIGNGLGRDCGLNRRRMEGSWDVEDGPRIQIDRHVKLLRALTLLTLGRPLFRFKENTLINYPVTENAVVNQL